MPRRKLSLTDRWAHLYTVARTLGLSAQGAATLRHHWQGLPRPEVVERASRLLLAARHAADAANVTDPSKVQTALVYFNDFCSALPGRDMFMVPRYRGDLDAEAYNEASFSMFAQFLREAAQPPLKQGTIGGHVS